MKPDKRTRPHIVRVDRALMRRLTERFPESMRGHFEASSRLHMALIFLLESGFVCNEDGPAFRTKENQNPT